MFRAHNGPCRRIDDYIGVVLDDQRARHFRKTQVVTNAQPDRKLADLAADEVIAGRKTDALIERRSRHKMSLSVFREDFTLRVHKNLRVKNGLAVAVRNSGNNRD